jgi:large subunit ribosomal protein L17
MRHKVAGKKLNRTSKHRKALLKNLAQALISNGSIKTTVSKAKFLRPFLEKMLTVAKKPSLHTRRLIYSRLYEKNIAKHLIEVVAPIFSNRNGGYTRIIKCGFRYGDNAPMAIIQFVDDVPQLAIGDNNSSSISNEKKNID